MARRGSDDAGRRDEWDETGFHDIANDSAEYEAYDRDGDGRDDYDDDGDGGYDGGDSHGYSDEYSAYDRALAPREELNAPAPFVEAPETGPVVIPGTGVSMGSPFIRRRARPLTMRLAVVTLVAALIVTGLVSVTPLGASAQPSVSSFEALSGAIVLSNKPGYFWYTAQWNDTPEKLATNFNVKVGGIFQMNNLCPGQELTVGKQYKIPTDPNYGATYEQQLKSSGQCGAINPTGYSGQTVFGTNWWNSYAGPNGTAEGRCSPAHGPSYMDFKFISPNWNSNWVRGFSFFHDGVDMAAPQGNPIHAVQDGQVIWAGYDGTNGFGWSVVINHCYHVSTLYGHMMGLAHGLRAGDNVSQGDVIGYEGNTGWSTGPHLHISIDWNNVPVNPMLFYADPYHITHYVPND